MLALLQSSLRVHPALADPAVVANFLAALLEAALQQQRDHGHLELHVVARTPVQLGAGL